MQYREFNERRRLSGQMNQPGVQTGMPTAGAFLFGLPFVGAGVAVALVGVKMIPVNPSTVHAPYWVLTVFGECFFAAGLMLWSMAVRQYRLNRRRSQLKGGGPESIALADYNWNSRGCQSSAWGKVGKAFGFALALTVFLSIFNWWAFFSADGPFMVKCIVSLFDLLLLFLWGHFFLLLARALRFSRTRIDYTRFPYPIGEPIVIRWLAPKGLSKPTKGSFTLRCVEEWREIRGTGKNRSSVLVKEEIWSGLWLLDPTDDLVPGKRREFNFAPTAGMLPTKLNAPKPIYWEFEVKLVMSGPDFQESYLVPVYA